MALPYQCTATLERMHVLVTEGPMFSRPQAPAAGAPRRHAKPKKARWRLFPGEQEREGVEALPDEVLHKLAVDSESSAPLLFRTSKHLRKVMTNAGAGLKRARLPFAVTSTSYITPETTSETERREAMLLDLQTKSTSYTLTSIDVRHFGLGATATVAYHQPPQSSLAASLQNCPALQKLTLKYTGVTDWTAIGKALANCTQLERLHIVAGPRIPVHDRPTFEHVFRGIASATHLTDLSFSQCDLFGVSVALAAQLPAYVALTRLDLSFNGLDHTDAAGYPVLVALAQCPRLQHLDLSSNEFHDGAADALAVALPRCTSLTHLDLSRNHFIDMLNFTRMLSQLQWRDTPLRHLSLSRNRFLSANALLRLFTQGGCALLTSLDVSCCDAWVAIRDEGAYQTPLAQVMALCTNLTELRLAGNDLGDFFGHLLCTTVLPACTSLALLDLADTKLSEHGVRALAPKFITCPNLIRLNLRDNRIDDTTKSQLQKHWTAVHAPEGLVM